MNLMSRLAPLTTVAGTVPPERTTVVIACAALAPEARGAAESPPGCDDDRARLLAEPAPARDDADHLRAQLAALRDELRATRRQLLHGEKMASLGQLVAGVAHEINNPISFIVGNLGPMRRTLDALVAAVARSDDAAVSRLVGRLGRMLETMGHGAERTATIVQDLRTFSRTGTEEPVPYDVHDGIETSLRLLRPKWHDRIAIERDYGERAVVRAVSGEIDQVLMNLLANACDAVVGRGVIRVTTERADDTLRIAVADDGVGIAADVLGRIFEPFFTTKSQMHGTGLGLSISRAIVEEHGGRLEAESRVGVGSVFTAVLPVEPR